MFARRIIRLVLRHNQHAKLAHEISKLGYLQTPGYCHGGAMLYAIAKLTDSMNEFKQWISLLPKTSNLSEFIKSIDEKHEKGEPLSHSEKKFLEKLPDDPRTFLDNLVLLHHPADTRNQPYLLHPVESQHDTTNVLLAVKEDNVVKIFSDIGIKTPTELQTYLNGLSSIVHFNEKNEKGGSNQYVMLLSAANHTAALTPHSSHKGWELFDMNQLPFVDIQSKDIGDEISHAFLVEEDVGGSFIKGSKEFIKALIFQKYTAFHIQILTTAKNPKLEKVFLDLQEFKMDQPLTSDIATRTTNFGTSLLHLAAHYDENRLAKQLIKLGANVNQTRKNGWRPIHYATKTKSAETLKILLDHKADVTPLTDMRSTPLMLAAGSGHTEPGRCLLLQYRKIATNNTAFQDLIDAKDCSGATALWHAAQIGATDMVELLLEYGANPLIKDSNGTAPHVIACGNNHADVVELIFKKLTSLNNANFVNTIDNSGLTGACYAAVNGHDEVIRRLGKYGANLGQYDPSRPFPLLLAIQYGKPKAIRALAECKVHIDMTISDGKADYTVAHIAVMNKVINVIRLFSEIGIDFTRETAKSNGSAITFAITTKQWDIAARMLMSITNVSNINERDKKLILEHKIEISTAYEKERKFFPPEELKNALQIILGITPKETTKSNTLFPSALQMKKDDKTIPYQNQHKDSKHKLD